MTITKNTPPAASVLEACERAMTVALAHANAARKAGDKSAEAHWLARLSWWTAQATERLQEVA
jgi:hypothetical protein